MEGTNAPTKSPKTASPRSTIFLNYSTSKRSGELSEKIPPKEDGMMIVTIAETIQDGIQEYTFAIEHLLSMNVSLTTLEVVGDGSTIKFVPNFAATRTDHIIYNYSSNPTFIHRS